MDESLSRRQLFLNATAATLALGVGGCGYLLYPERRGRLSGSIDTPIMIVDLLWLLPGIVPGVICLIVDFTTGCIYRTGGRAAIPSREQSDHQIVNALVAVEGATVAMGNVSPEGKVQLRWDRPVDESTLKADGRLFLRRQDGATAEAFIRELIGPVPAKT